MAMDSVKEIRRMKKKMQDRIMREMQKFEEETGIDILKIDFGRDRSTPRQDINNVWLQLDL